VCDQKGKLRVYQDCDSNSEVNRGFFPVNLVDEIGVSIVRLNRQERRDIGDKCYNK
jgi:hypothetical protein